MTQEEKAKAYDEALAAIKGKYEMAKKEKAWGTVKWMEEVFPVLAESEDERIRKNLIELLLDTPVQDIISHHLELSKVLAYLEKQKEQKPPEWDDSVAKDMFIKALERAVEQTKKGYELTDCDKHSWWEDFKAYNEIKPAEWSEEDEAIACKLEYILRVNYVSPYIIKWALEHLRPQPHWKQK